LNGSYYVLPAAKVATDWSTMTAEMNATV